jgi:hypothetical protein
VSQRPLYGGLDREDFAQGQLLCALGGEATVSMEDDVNDILRVLEILSPRLVTYRCFTATPTEGYPQVGEFVGRVSPRSGTRRCKEHKV